MKKKVLAAVLSLSMILSTGVVAMADETKDPSEVKVGVITDVGGVNDGSFNQSAWEGLTRANEELGITTIIVTHDPEEALTLSDRVLIIDQGTISQYAKPDEIIHQPKNDFVRKFILRQLEIKRGNIYALFGDRPQLAGEAV